MFIARLCVYCTHIHNFVLSHSLWFTASEFSLNLKSSIYVCIYVCLSLSLSICVCVLLCTLCLSLSNPLSVNFGTWCQNFFENLHSVSFHVLVGIQGKSTQWIRNILFSIFFLTWISGLNPSCDIRNSNKCYKREINYHYRVKKRRWKKKTEQKFSFRGKIKWYRTIYWVPFNSMSS